MGHRARATCSSDQPDDARRCPRPTLHSGFLLGDGAMASAASGFLLGDGAMASAALGATSEAADAHTSRRMGLHFAQNVLNVSMQER